MSGSRPSRLTVAGALAALSAVTALVFVTIGATPAAATAEPVGQCTTVSGVLVAVDFGHWGGPLVRGCGSTPTTGFALLNQGGWFTQGTLHDGNAFICRIGYAGFSAGQGYPTSATEACVQTPPANAYWSFWRAGPGQNAWSYSQVGPASDSPQAGTVELWTFGATDLTGVRGLPVVSPDAVRAYPPVAGTPAPTPSSTHPTGTGAPVSSTPAAATRPGAAGASPSTAAPGQVPGKAPGSGTVPAGTAGQQSAGAAASAARAAAPAGVVDALPATAAAAASGSPLPALAGLGLVVALGGAAGAAGAARRRRRTGPS